jgi:hypothetical protein
VARCHMGASMCGKVPHGRINVWQGATWAHQCVRDAYEVKVEDWFGTTCRAGV